MLISIASIVRVRAYVYPIATRLGGVRRRPRPCQHLQVGVKGGINLDEVLSFIMSEWAQRGMGERGVDAGGAMMAVRGTRTARTWRKRTPCSVHPRSISGHSVHISATVMSPPAPCGVVPSPQPSSPPNSTPDTPKPPMPPTTSMHTIIPTFDPRTPQLLSPMHKLRLLFLEDSEAQEAILVLMGVRRVCSHKGFK